MTTKTVDQWAAAQCGVVLCEDEIRYESPNTAGWEYGEWAIKDPRCREIVREHFKINTSYIDRNKWRSVEMKWRKKEPDSTGSYCMSATGQTIAEAECNCITAIFEASQ